MRRGIASKIHQRKDIGNSKDISFCLWEACSLLLQFFECFQLDLLSKSSRNFSEERALLWREISWQGYSCGMLECGEEDWGRKAKTTDPSIEGWDA